MGMVGQRHPPAALPPKRPGTHCIGGWLGLRAGLDRCGKSSPPTGMRSPNPPARSQSLYLLSYPGPRTTVCLCIYLYGVRPACLALWTEVKEIKIHFQILEN